MFYKKFSTYLKDKYGTKVYKLPVNISVGCPNRDKNNKGGCIFCSDDGANFEMLSCGIDIKKQIKINKSYIGKNYNSKKFIAYFQNYSNTYIKLDVFEKYVDQAASIDDILAVYISTRPDLINNEYLSVLKTISTNRKVDIVIELGLQTVNYKTLKIINRGHTLAEFIDAVFMIKQYNFEVCVHVIPDLPMDDIEDVIECAKIISSLRIEQVKCHSLYILEGTILGDMYLDGRIKTVEFEEFLNRIIVFLEYLDPEIAIQRLLGRAPEGKTLFCNFGMSWWKIIDRINEEMEKRNTYQGRLFDYLNGKGFRNLQK